VLTGEAGGLVEQLEIGLDLTRRLGALHLDDDAAAVRQDGSVHLPYRRRRDRHLLELEKELVDRKAELLPDDALDVLERKRADRVLQRLQLEHDVGRNDVGPG
jgi:hypothetical protein